MNLNEKQLSAEYMYKGRIINLRRDKALLPNGEEAIREVIWMYAASELEFGDCDPDDDEFLAVERYPLEKAVEMILSGEIKDAKTQVAVLKLKLLHDMGEI